MKIKKIERINDILIIQMNHWALYPVALTIMGLAGSYTGEGSPVGILWGICGLMVIFYYFLRERVERLFLFMVLHLALVLLFFVLPVRTGAGRFLCAACGIGYFIQSMAKRFRERVPGTSAFSPVAAIGISVVCIFLQHYQGRFDWDFYYVLALVSVLALYLVTCYIRKYLEFLAVNASSTGYLPAADIFRSGMGLVGGYTVLGTVILLFCTNFDWLRGVWNSLKSVVVSILRFVFSLLLRDAIVEDEELIQETPSAGAMQMPLLPEASEPFLLWQILEVVFVTAVSCVVLYFAVKLFIRLIKFVRQRFAEGFGQRKDREIGEEDVDVREKCDLAKPAVREGQKRTLFGFLTLEQRIRKLYKKKILASAFELTDGGKDDVGSLMLLTARECGERLGAIDMSDIYEQVRYSDKEATQETLRRMKEACKG